MASSYCLAAMALRTVRSITEHRESAFSRFRKSMSTGGSIIKDTFDLRTTVSEFLYKRPEVVA